MEGSLCISESSITWSLDRLHLVEGSLYISESSISWSLDRLHLVEGSLCISESSITWSLDRLRWVTGSIHDSIDAAPAYWTARLHIIIACSLEFLCFTTGHDSIALAPGLWTDCTWQQVVHMSISLFGLTTPADKQFTVSLLSRNLVFGQTVAATCSEVSFLQRSFCMELQTPFHKLSIWPPCGTMLTGKSMIFWVSTNH